MLLAEQVKFIHWIIQMQVKDPRKAHLYISLVKSVIRVMAGAALMSQMFYTAGILIIVAEGLGILEEIV